MGFPELQKLDLNAQESSLLKKMLDEVLKEYDEKIKWLATFYDACMQRLKNFTLK